MSLMTASTPPHGHQCRRRLQHRRLAHATAPGSCSWRSPTVSAVRRCRLPAAAACCRLRPAAACCRRPSWRHLVWNQTRRQRKGRCVLRLSSRSAHRPRRRCWRRRKRAAAVAAQWTPNPSRRGRTRGNKVRLAHRQPAPVVSSCSWSMPCRMGQRLPRLPGHCCREGFLRRAPSTTRWATANHVPSCTRGMAAGRVRPASSAISADQVRSASAGRKTRTSAGQRSAR
mmetsp:Transcript_28638/g.72466  ORF Transcript_28638/g.72466 Transcript_28638/m.72466 type:complete len:228 (+) Transcript_28638:173-856(+)